MADGSDPARPPRDHRQDVLAIARRLGLPTDPVTPLGGQVNAVFRVGGDWVVRQPVDPLQEDTFPVEAWAMAAARRVGIVTPEVVATGVEAGVPFMVQRYVPPSADPPDRPWWWLGRYAREVARIPLEGAPSAIYTRFGPDLEGAWRRHVEYNLDALTDDDPLLADGAYRRDDVGRVRAAIEALRDERFDVGLVHGDLAPRNLLSCGRDQAPVLIDWGNAKTGPAPWTDAQQVYHWAVCDRSITWEDAQEFVRAAGVDDQGTLARLTVLQLLDVVRWAADRRPDRYDHCLKECRDGLPRVLARLENDPEMPVIES